LALPAQDARGDFWTTSREGDALPSRRLTFLVEFRVSLLDLLQRTFEPMGDRPRSLRAGVAAHQ
jgi:hypothetical protein